LRDFRGTNQPALVFVRRFITDNLIEGAGGVRMRA